MLHLGTQFPVSLLFRYEWHLMDAHRETPSRARAQVAQLREALADAKAEVLDHIRELQAAQRDVEKAEYDREAKVGKLGSSPLA